MDRHQSQPRRQLPARPSPLRPGPGYNPAAAYHLPGEYPLTAQANPLPQDTYREPRPVGPPTGDFSFRTQQQFPTGPRHGPPQPEPQGRYARKGAPGLGRRANFDFSTKPSDRALIRAGRAPTPEQFPTLGPTAQRFKQVEDVDASDLSKPFSIEPPTHHGFTPINRPQANREQFGSFNGAPGNYGTLATKIWSNPDPYTSLPPPSEARPIKDFVRLIRSARVDQNTSATNAGGGGDYISLDAEPFPVTNSFPYRAKQDVKSRAPSGLPLHSKARSSSIDDARWPPGSNSVSTIRLAPPGSLPNKPPGNNMKRPLIDLDNGEPAESTRPPKKKAKARQLQSTVTANWVGNEQPWNTTDHSHLPSPSQRLHHEIRDFFDYVRPRDFEDYARRDLVARTTKVFTKEFPNSEVKCFGSFAAGIYLPNADMDVVVLSRPFQERGEKFFSKNKLFRVGRLLSDTLAVRTTVDTVLSAKVPIVKYVDALTGLKVDVSFDNSSGLPAISTCLGWKNKFPAMPYILSLVKQFIKMRGQDEVFTGGLGGFSATCLVVSLLQHIKVHKGRDFDPLKNLGQTLLFFFDFYGNKFNTTKHAIQMEPPRYSFKTNPLKHRPWALSIIDPNNAANDISKGSTNSEGVFRLFADAHDTLSRRLHEMEGNTSDRGTALGCLFAGNYRYYRDQRYHLDECFGRD